MSTVMFKIPLSEWVMGTINKMDAANKDDFLSWSRFWFATYLELGGEKSSGSKLRPQHAAYGLWRMGRIAGGKAFSQRWVIEEINTKYGKNAAYAALTLDLLEAGWSPLNPQLLWSKVKELYWQRFKEPAAETQQGAVKVAVILFKQGKITPRTS